MAKIQAVRGMRDILPAESAYWHRIEACIQALMKRYGYQEIRMPAVESTALFCRSIGEVTDIVEKEMYTFEDKNGDSLTLRPEGTAQCVRACLEHGLIHNQVQRLWYYGPMFRHERPQKGRYRQFYQLGVETFGVAGPDVEAEHINLMSRFWAEMGVQDDVRLEINSLGSLADRARYRDALIAYFDGHADALDDDSKRRLHRNPLRILDSKNPDMQAIIAGAPDMADFRSTESQAHFETLCGHLDACGIAYTINPRLVRGIDYYCHTVYEWVTDKLGAQGTVCGGGRYDGLVAECGGRATPAVGFSMGIERLVFLLMGVSECQHQVDAYMVVLDNAAIHAALQLSETLRSDCVDFHLQMHCGGGSPKSQFKKADQSGARWAFIMGADEMAQSVVTIKDLRGKDAQVSIAWSELPAWIQGAKNG